jgi:hypothetical protein
LHPVRHHREASARGNLQNVSTSHHREVPIQVSLLPKFERLQNHGEWRFPRPHFLLTQLLAVTLSTRPKSTGNPKPESQDD